MRAENYIIKGTFFRSKIKEQYVGNALSDIQIIIKGYFISKGYKDTSPFFLGIKYLEQEFHLAQTPKISKIKKLFGQGEKTQATKQYFNNLKKTRQDLPGEIKVHVYPGRYNETDGFFVDIISKPIKYLKITQLNESPEISQSEYSFIMNENIEFLNSFAKANSCSIVKEPLPISIFIKTEISDKLRRYGFVKIAEFLEKTNEKLEIGKSVEAVDELVRAIENFLVDLIANLKETPKGLHQPEKNIQLLKDKSYINNEMQGVVYGVLYNNAYLPLKNHEHLGKDFDLFDLRYIYELAEQSIDYLLEKVWRYKVK